MKNKEAKTIKNVNIPIERAVIFANCFKTRVLITLNEVRFCINPNTTLDDAISTYTEVSNKISRLKEQSKQNIK